MYWLLVEGLMGLKLMKSNMAYILKLQCTVNAYISINLKVRIFKISKNFFTSGANHVCHSLFLCYGHTITH